MLLRLVSVLCCVLAAKACMKCISTVTALEEKVINSAPTEKNRREAERIRNYTIGAYGRTSEWNGDVIDPATLFRIQIKYEEKLHKFLVEVNPDDTAWTTDVMKKVDDLFRSGNSILRTEMEALDNVLCPNQCGRLIRRAMNCSSCDYILHDCPPRRGPECGEIQVAAEEGSYVVLNCSRPWHRLLVGNAKYHYSWAQSEEDDFKPLVVTRDAIVVLNQLHLDRRGTYRCSLQNSDTVFYQLTYRLTVKPFPVQTRRPRLTLPPLPRPDSPGGLLVPLLIAITVLSLVVTFGLAIVLVCVKTNRWNKPKKKRLKTIDLKLRDGEGHSKTV